MTRPLIFAANWKMHLGPSAAAEFMADFLSEVRERESRTLWFFPPAPSMAAVARATAKRLDVLVGAQNIYWEPKGAFTGELSVDIVADAGADGALVGHSERRHKFGESDADTGRKVRALLDGDLAPMLCVGETLGQRDAGETESVCLRQLEAGLGALAPGEWQHVMLAYEPVWAIGTGRNAEPADAAKVHSEIRSWIAARTDVAVPVLYGGSVNAGNVEAILHEEQIDGVLVGGASLDSDGWARIVRLGD